MARTELPIEFIEVAHPATREQAQERAQERCDELDALLGTGTAEHAYRIEHRPRPQALGGGELHVVTIVRQLDDGQPPEGPQDEPEPPYPGMSPGERAAPPYDQDADEPRPEGGPDRFGERSE